MLVQRMEIWRPGKAPQKIVLMAILKSGSRGREKEGRETGIMEGFEPSVRKPISLRDGHLPPARGQRHFLFSVKVVKMGCR